MRDLTNGIKYMCSLSLIGIFGTLLFSKEYCKFPSKKIWESCTDWKELCLNKFESKQYWILLFVVSLARDEHNRVCTAQRQKKKKKKFILNFLLKL